MSSVPLTPVTRSTPDYRKSSYWNLTADGPTQKKQKSRSLPRRPRDRSGAQPDNSLPALSGPASHTMVLDTSRHRCGRTSPTTRKLQRPVDYLKEPKNCSSQGDCREGSWTFSQLASRSVAPQFQNLDLHLPFQTVSSDSRLLLTQRRKFQRSLLAVC
jgi:hypothetical protein